NFISPTRQQQFLYGGGNRIRKIGYFDVDVNQDYYKGPAFQDGIIPAKEKYYNYNFFGTNKSSGSLVFAKPVYKYEESRSYFNECPPFELCASIVGVMPYTIYTQFNNLMSLRTHGSDVGYKNVTVSELSSSQGNNGYSQFIYSSPIDEPETNYTLTPPF